MRDNILILSDIHANLTALTAVLKVAQEHSVKKIIILGDIIDYGMRPNETIKLIKELPFDVIANLQGNHEMSYLKGEFTRFSSDRGRESLRQTIKMLNDESIEYIRNVIEPSGRRTLEVAGRKILLIHGSLSDEYWGKLDFNVDAEEYSEYDIVISAHTHKSHYFIKAAEKCDGAPPTSSSCSSRANSNSFSAEKCDGAPPTSSSCSSRANSNSFSVEKCDGKGKSIRFINCGSVGQPRNGITSAQFVIVDSLFQNFSMCSAPYDIANEQSLYDGRLDDYYKTRLAIGE